MKLVMVHGIAQRGKDPAALQREWTDAIKDGWARDAAPAPADFDVAVAFYADTLGALVDDVERDLPDDLAARGPDSRYSDLAQTQRRLMADVLQAAGVGGTEVSRELGPINARDPQNWGWVLAASRVLARIPGLDAAIIDKYIKEVSVYLTVPQARAAVDTIVNETIDDDAAVVVGHSLGSVVSYNVLRTRPPTTTALSLTTLGSPLAINGVRDRLTIPLVYPPAIGDWFNAFDPTDIVALFPLDSRHFDVDPEIDNYGEVRNFTSNRHGIKGYLSDPIVAKRIAAQLRNTRPV